MVPNLRLVIFNYILPVAIFLIGYGSFLANNHSLQLVIEESGASSSSAVKSVAQVAGSVMSFASGGFEKAITSSGSVALSAVENNHDLHQIQALLEMEARGELETGTTVEDLRQQPLGQAAEFVVENPARALDISTDIASIVYYGGPQGAVAKKALVSGISKATKLVGFGKKPAKLEKLTGPVGGLVIDHMPVGSSINLSFA